MEARRSCIVRHQNDLFIRRSLNERDLAVLEKRVKVKQSSEHSHSFHHLLCVTLPSTSSLKFKKHFKQSLQSSNNLRRIKKINFAFEIYALKSNQIFMSRHLYVKKLCLPLSSTPPQDFQIFNDATKVFLFNLSQFNVVGIKDVSKDLVNKVNKSWIIFFSHAVN